MNKYILFGLFIVSLFIVSCGEYSKSEIKIENSEFTKEVTDSVILNVEDTGSPILLQGKIKLIEGKCMLLMTDPLEDTVYYKTLTAPGTLKLDEQFERTAGTWTFRYKILALDKVAPNGNYSINLMYKD